MTQQHSRSCAIVCLLQGGKKVLPTAIWPNGHTKGCNSCSIYSPQLCKAKALCKDTSVSTILSTKDQRANRCGNTEYNLETQDQQQKTMEFKWTAIKCVKKKKKSLPLLFSTDLFSAFTQGFLITHRHFSLKISGTQKVLEKYSQGIFPPHSLFPQELSKKHCPVAQSKVYNPCSIHGNCISLIAQTQWENNLKVEKKKKTQI